MTTPLATWKPRLLVRHVSNEAHSRTGTFHYASVSGSFGRGSRTYSPALSLQFVVCVALELSQPALVRDPEPAVDTRHRSSHHDPAKCAMDPLECQRLSEPEHDDSAVALRYRLECPQRSVEDSLRESARSSFRRRADRGSARPRSGDPECTACRNRRSGRSRCASAVLCESSPVFRIPPTRPEEARFRTSPAVADHNGTAFRWTAGRSTVPGTSRRRSNSSGVVTTSLEMGTSRSATRTSIPFSRREPASGIVIGWPTWLSGPAVPRACDPNRMIRSGIEAAHDPSDHGANALFDWRVVSSDSSRQSHSGGGGASLKMGRGPMNSTPV